VAACLAVADPDGMTDVLSDIRYACLYSSERMAQGNASETDYLLGNTLVSMRQLVNASGAVKLSQSYDVASHV
jgi:hypothetical protein